MEAQGSKLCSLACNLTKQSFLFTWWLIDHQVHARAEYGFAGHRLQYLPDRVGNILLLLLRQRTTLKLRGYVQLNDEFLLSCTLQVLLPEYQSKRILTSKRVRHIDIPTRVCRHQRVRTERRLPDRPVGIWQRPARQGLRHDPALDPVDQGLEPTVGVIPDAATTMPSPGREEKAEIIRRVGIALQHALVVLDGAVGEYQRSGQAMPGDHLAAGGAEVGQVRVVGAENRGVLADGLAEDGIVFAGGDVCEVEGWVLGHEIGDPVVEELVERGNYVGVTRSAG